MASRSLSVTVSMPVEMDEKLQEEAKKHGMKYSEYVRHVLRDNGITPFERPSASLEKIETDRQEGAA